MNHSLFDALLATVALAVGVVWLCHRLKVPVIVGFLLSGALCGPHGIRLVHSVHEVEQLAEIGVILLLFTIGVEFSLRRMLEIRRLVVLGGALQVGLTIVAVAGVARIFGLPPAQTLFLGFLGSLSSTAIVLQVLAERGEIDSPHGRALLGILIFQDIIVVPMMLLTPRLGGAATTAQPAAWWLLLKALAVLALTAVAARWVVPFLFYQVARTRSRELFLLTVVIACLIAARLTQLAGLSLALGAFLAGLAISESEYGHHVLGGVLPLRDLFTSFFFISMGMMLDGGYLAGHLATVLSVASGVMLLKAALAGLAALLLGLPLRTAVLNGLSLAQVGEFSFILSREGTAVGLLAGDLGQLFIAGSIVTMSATPFVIAAAPRVAEAVCRGRLVRRWADRPDPYATAETHAWRDHLVMIGYGLNGRNVTRAARLAGIPYLIVELNAETVREQRALGEPILYGDATRTAVLEHAHVAEARTVVVAINDPAATRAIVRAVRGISPTVGLIVRTRFASEIAALTELGADEVIPEEYETSVAIFARVLANWLVPADEIEAMVAAVRAEGYGALLARDAAPAARLCPQLDLADAEIRSVRLPPGSPWAGASLGELQLRTVHRVTVLAVRRETGLEPNPDGAFRLRANDVLVLLGTPEDLAAAARAAR